MNKVAVIGMVIAIIIGIAIIGTVSTSLPSENALNENKDIDEPIVEPTTTGRSLSIELKESVGMKANP